MTAIFRCDATTGIGFGHVSRCIALAEAFRICAVDSVFAGLFDPAARNQIAAAGFKLIDLAKPVGPGNAERAVIGRSLQNSPGSFVVVDSYRADESYLAQLKEQDIPVVVIDDFRALSVYPCDVILNFTWEANSLGYPDGPALLLGPRYFLGRRRLVELRPLSIARDRRGPIRNLLIAIGGSDPKSIAARLVHILSRGHRDLCLNVIAANESDFPDGLSGFAQRSRILSHQPDLSEQFLWADACITGGGLIKYESVFMGVPAAAVAQNQGQAGESQALRSAGLVFDLGLADDRSDEELAGQLDRFFADAALRDGMGARMRATFSADPPACAAREIMEAIAR